MIRLPVVHMTLYKHGVGFFRRRGTVDGEAVKLTFRREEMDDLLKSLTVIDQSGGQVRGIDYDTPQKKNERLEGCSVQLGDRRSLRDLVMALRGRDVQLNVNDGNTVEGTLLGLDESDEKPLKRLLVSILETDTQTTKVIALERLEGLKIKDNTAFTDLRFFLDTEKGQESHRSITIRLNPGTHDLEVSYIVPAPGWRVSYRLVTEEKKESNPEALLLGWGIFDNRLEEDLNDVSVSLTAGMPISFIYDLYTPHVPERPVVKEETPVTSAPVMFESAMEEDAVAEAMPPMAAAAPAVGAGPPMMRGKKLPQMARSQALSIDGLSGSVGSVARGEAKGELFKYDVEVPVTVGRGQSAMVPIVKSRPKLNKELIYNGSKVPVHPVATFRVTNNTGLTLEQGPLTVLENGEYVGEAVLPFTPSGAEAVISYAFELGVKVKEETHVETQLHQLTVKDRFLVQQRYDIRRTTYSIDNKTDKPKNLLIEHPHRQRFEPFDMPEPDEKTLDTLRYNVSCSSGKVTVFTVQERALRTQRDALHNLSLQTLLHYFENRFLDKKTYEQLKEILDTVAEISKLEKSIQQKEKQRQTIYQAQTQIGNKMQVLSKEGEEGRLRGRYVQQLNQQEEQLADIDRFIADTRQEIQRKNSDLDQLLGRLK